MAYPEAKRLIRVVWLGVILVVIIGSLLPGTSAPMRLLDSLHVPDKVEHFLAYVVLAFLPTIHERRGFIIAAAIGAVALGVGPEYAQLYSGWRDFEVGNMVADTAGVLTGAAAGLPMRSIEVVRPLLSPPTGQSG
jgi:VanZ family protein